MGNAIRKIRKILFGIIGYIWIAATIGGLIYLIIQKDYLNAFRVCAQAFAVVGFALYVARKLEYRRHTGFAIFLIFIGSVLISIAALQSLGYVQLKDIIEVSSLKEMKKLMDFKTAIYTAAPIFLVSFGSCLTVAYVSYMSTYRSRCNYEVMAICNDYDERRFDGPYKCPIYEVVFNGTTYFISNGVFINKNIPKIGERVRLKINYDDPTEFRLMKNDPHESGGLMALGLALIAFGIAFAFLARKYNLV